MRTVFFAALLGLGVVAGCSDSSPATAPAGGVQPDQVSNPPGPDGKPGKGRIPPPK